MGIAIEEDSAVDAEEIAADSEAAKAAINKIPVLTLKQQSAKTLKEVTIHQKPFYIFIR